MGTLWFCILFFLGSEWGTWVDSKLRELSVVVGGLWGWQEAPHPPSPCRMHVEGLRVEEVDSYCCYVGVVPPHLILTEVPQGR